MILNIYPPEHPTCIVVRSFDYKLIMRSRIPAFPVEFLFGIKIPTASIILVLIEANDYFTTCNHSHTENLSVGAPFTVDRVESVSQFLSLHDFGGPG